MQMAMDAVWTHRFRSLLTILGIVIGITTVVTVASLLTGLRQGVVDFFQELGPDNIFLTRPPGDPKRRTRRSAQGAQAPRHEAGVCRLHQALVPDRGGHCARRCSFRRWWTATRSRRACPASNRTPSTWPAVAANNGRHCAARFRAGRFFTPEEDQRGAHVAVIGDNVADALFPDGNAVDRTFMMDGAEYHGDRRLRQGQGRILRRERRWTTP